jgi:hypothetical protein
VINFVQLGGEKDFVKCQNVNPRPHKVLDNTLLFE